MALLEVDDLSVRFDTDDGPVHAVDRLSFDLEPGSLVVHGRTAAGDEGAIDDERLALSSQILEVVADGHDLTAHDGEVEFSARKNVRGGGVG